MTRWSVAEVGIVCLAARAMTPWLAAKGQTGCSAPMATTSSLEVMATICSMAARAMTCWLVARVDHFQNGATGGWRFVYTSAADSRPGAFDIYDNFRAYDPAAPGAHDVIDLSAMDADTTRAGTQHFSLVGGPSGTAGELWYIRGGIGGDIDYYEFSWIMGDVDGDGEADLEIRLPTMISDENLIL